jgi:hypothetical protein
MKRIAASAIALIFVISSLAHSEVPQMINYQGRLTDSDGIPIDATVSITFTIYDDSTGGATIWTETHNSVTVTGGLFDVLLGSTVPVNDSVFSDPIRYLGIIVGGDSEIQPRTRIVTAPYACRAVYSDVADHAETVSTIDGAAGGTVIGTVTIESELSVTNRATFGSENSNTYDYSFVVGESNAADGEYTTVTGGQNNSAGAFYCFIGGGDHNSAVQSNAVVAGGRQNHAFGSFSNIAGGESDTANGNYSSVGGGIGNYAGDYYSIVAGGTSNRADGESSVIVGGQENQAIGDRCFVGGGRSNISQEANSTIVGGAYNTASYGGVIGGGSFNVASSGAFVGGGYSNEASAGASAICGGDGNSTYGGPYSFVGCGEDNRVSSHYSVLGGGYKNWVHGTYSVIPGGFCDTILSASYAYLFGIGSKLTQDSTFMVDMPYIRFGDETSGYQMPTEDGSVGQVLTTDGNGQVAWSDITAPATMNAIDELRRKNTELEAEIAHLKRLVQKLANER